MATIAGSKAVTSQLTSWIGIHSASMPALPMMLTSCVPSPIGLMPAAVMTLTLPAGKPRNISRMVESGRQICISIITRKLSLNASLGTNVVCVCVLAYRVDAPATDHKPREILEAVMVTVVPVGGVAARRHRRGLADGRGQQCHSKHADHFVRQAGSQLSGAADGSASWSGAAGGRASWRLDIRIALQLHVVADVDTRDTPQSLSGGPNQQLA